MAREEVGVANSEIYAAGEVEPMPKAPLKKEFKVVVAPPLIVNPPACVPLPTVLEALTIIPNVVVGAK